jgi:hypothetical protein
MPILLVSRYEIWQQQFLSQVILMNLRSLKIYHPTIQKTLHVLRISQGLEPLVHILNVFNFWTLTHAL